MAHWNYYIKGFDSKRYVTLREEYGRVCHLTRTNSKKTFHSSPASLSQGTFQKDINSISAFHFHHSLEWYEYS